MSKIRLDQYLCQNGLVQSRERAKAMIMSGIVFVDAQKVAKAGEMIRHRPVHGRLYRLYAANRRGQGLRRRCRLRPAGVEPAYRCARHQYGKNEHPQCKA